MKLKALPFPRLPHDLDKVPDGKLSIAMLDENFDAIHVNMQSMHESLETLVVLVDHLIKLTKGKK